MDEEYVLKIYANKIKEYCEHTSCYKCYLGKGGRCDLSRMPSQWPTYTVESDEDEEDKI